MDDYAGREALSHLAQACRALKEANREYCQVPNRNPSDDGDWFMHIRALQRILSSTKEEIFLPVRVAPGISEKDPKINS